MSGLSIHLGMKMDLNCDMGEGMSTDALIMPFISSANIACGGHTGDASTMHETILMAKKYQVAVGAHPSYPDRENFGRKEMHLSDDVLYHEVSKQIHTIKKIAEEEHTVLHHVKPHGALYNTAAKNTQVAETIAKAIYDIDPALKVYGLPNSIFEKICKEKGLHFIGEGFADRTYSEDGSLTPRSMPNALITDTAASIEQAMEMVRKGMVQTTSGACIPMPVKTICIHGDGQHAIAFAKALHATFKQHKIAITH